MRGFTLLEVLVATAIAIVAGALLIVIIVNSTGLFYQQSSKISEGLNTNTALSTIRSSIKQATAISAQYTSGSTTYISGSTQLVLKVASIDASNEIISDTFDYFVFFLDQNYLRFKIFPDVASSRQAADQILSTSIDNLLFQYFNSATPPEEVIPVQATKVVATISLKQRIGVDFERLIATSEANLRND